MDKTFTSVEHLTDLIYNQTEPTSSTANVNALTLPLTLVVQEYPLVKDENQFFKRTFDVLFSLAVIAFFLSWMLPLLAIFIKLSSNAGPVFFKQKRTGLNNKTFTCYKLRSMRVNSEAHLKQASTDDDRITLAGKFMRKFSLDELPQFFCVLIGNMSVVGPRPHMLNHTEEFAKLVDNYIVRHAVKPGITGLSQVYGYRGEIRSARMLLNRVKFDLFYIEKWNFQLDMRIIFKTCKLVLFGDKNAY